MPDGYQIRELRLDDAAELALAYQRNRTHLERWDPRREPSFFTETGQAEALALQLRAVRGGSLIAWVLVHADRIVGRINLNNIVWGVFRSGSLGYWVDADHLRRGLASAAVEHAVEQAAERGLHRLEAGTLLDNVGSQRVLEAGGFESFGVAPSYLCIDGAWQDHRLYQRILHDRPV